MPQAPTINRKHRQEVATIVRQFLNDEISASEFSHLLEPYRSSDDATVSEVVFVAWFHHDDFKDHDVILTKSDWNYFQRLLLVLDSNDHLVKISSLKWGFSQLVALASLVAFGFAIFHFGFGFHLLLLTIPLLFLTLLIIRLRNREVPIAAYNNILNPFSTFTELKSTYEAVPEFRKTRYRKELSTRRIRSNAMHIFGTALAYCGWFVFSPFFLPFILFFLIFPDTQTHTRVVASSGKALLTV